MPKFEVVIIEKVTECRTYNVTADNPKAAAESASQTWLNAGENPEGGPSCDVVERDYEVYEMEDGEPKYVDHFATEIE